MQDIPVPVTRIALMGSPGSGKTSLAQALRGTWRGTGGQASSRWQVCDDSPLQNWLTSASAAAAPAREHGAPEMNSALEAALKAQGEYQHHLLLGPDLAPPSPEQHRFDSLLRHYLARAGWPFQVIYGRGELRLANALAALKAEPQPAPAAPAKRKPWVWACDKCSDPGCEHRLLSDLLAARRGAPD